MKKTLQNNLIELFSEKRLKSYKSNEDDNIIALEKYLYNMMKLT